MVPDEAVGARMQRQIARLAAFARHFEMRHALAHVAEVLDLELGELLAPQRMKEQGRENGAVALVSMSSFFDGLSRTPFDGLFVA